MTCRTYMDTQLSKIKATSAAHPPRFGQTIPLTWFRANGSQSDLLDETAGPTDAPFYGDSITSL